MEFTKRVWFSLIGLCLAIGVMAYYFGPRVVPGVEKYLPEEAFTIMANVYADSVEVSAVQTTFAVEDRKLLILYSSLTPGGVEFADQYEIREWTDRTMVLADGGGSQLVLEFFRAESGVAFGALLSGDGYRAEFYLSK